MVHGVSAFEEVLAICRRAENDVLRADMPPFTFTSGV